MMADYKDELIYDMELGKSIEGRPIMAYVFMLGTTKNDFEQDFSERQTILIDAVYHARELTTISQVVYTMLAMLHGYEHDNQEYIGLMENGAIIFIPLVNPDGVAYIDDYYAKTGGRFAFIRKNRNISYEKM